jgi:putative pyruvate formate lyase activating enzyme
MWYFIRPDAVSALEDPKVIEALPRYVDIVKNKKLAKFRICRLIPVEISGDESIEELWNIHKKLMNEYIKLEKELDEGKTIPSETPKFSLLHLKSTIAQRIMRSCILCERRCMKNREEGELGYCKVGKEMLVSSCFDHMGEEPEIVPSFTVYDFKSAELAWDAISGASTVKTGL